MPSEGEGETGAGAGDEHLDAERLSPRYCPAQSGTLDQALWPA